MTKTTKTSKAAKNTKTTKVTDLEAAVLWNLCHSEFTSVNGRSPESLDEVGAVWAHEAAGGIVSKKQVAGVVASLQKKGLVETMDDGKDAAIELTKAGWEAYKANQAFAVGAFEKAVKPTTKAKVEKVAEAEVEAKPETMAACATRMVIEGATNEEILLVLVDVYALPEAHAHYPGWYRAAAVRKGLVTKEFAQAHAH